jgi:hypothetical protein
VKKVEKDLWGSYTVGSSQVTAVIVLGQGWRTYETRAHNGTGKDFLGTRHSMLSHFFFIFYFYPTSVSILGRICAYVHISDYVETVHKLPLLPNYIASETFLHKSGVVRNAYWIFIVGAPAWRWLREYVTMDKKFYNFIFKRKVAAAPVTFTFTFLITFLGKTFLRKIIIIICINYNIYY